ncbi:MAG: hypothetical protein JJ858_08830 [Rhizobiaceae bacterium]|nr:hypothetical protein [Rhizobiaceae bacterium]
MKIKRLKDHAGLAALAFSLTISSLSSPVPSYAAENGDAGVRCVQNQLTSLDIDVGVIDGLFGKKTAAGAQQAVKDMPKLAELNELNPNNALMWCREMALASPKLKQYWPTQDGPKLEYFFSGSLSKYEQNSIKSAMEIADKYFGKFDVELPGTVKIVASDDLNAMARSINRVAHNAIPVKRGAEILKEQCEGKPLSGLNINGLIALCFDKKTDVTKRIRVLKDIAVHEYAHEVQRQYTSYTKALVRDRSEIVAINGPRWLVEGTAIAFASDYSYRGLRSEILIELIRENATRFSGRTLSTLRHGDAPKKQVFGSYASLAGYMVAQKKGMAGIIRFWEEMARNDWETAFASTFGLSINAFYREFDWQRPSAKKSLKPPILTKNDAGIACVQQQLTAYNINVGTIDGLYGRKTFRGVKMLIERYPVLADLDDLTRDNGLMWCRQIGLIDEALQIYWPANQTAFNYQFDQSIDIDFRKAIRSSASKVSKTLSELGFKPTGKVNVIASKNKDNLIAIVKQRLRSPVNFDDVKQDFDHRCIKAKTSGISTDGSIGLCLEDSGELDEEIMHLLAHEYLKQSAGYAWPDKQVSDQFFQFGPRWLYEGIAIALVDYMNAPKRSFADHIASRIKDSQSVKSELHQLEAYGSASPSKHQKRGAVAAHILAESGGNYNSFIVYWDELSRSNWQVAFETAFNISVGEFYKQIKDGSS